MDKLGSMKITGKIASSLEILMFLNDPTDLKHYGVFPLCTYL